MQTPPPKTMAFEFQPTTEWYLEQAGEGRGYEHMRVDSWEAFFKTFGVGDTHDK
jgi:hypothetical protein